ncbi:cyclic nucleotide-binding domain-containing protein [Aneurinibacillus sp. REN35]|uniref:cyclic nucleotide-binding domain-containing protein n=1 Tax=Aneurinibacillus sp. REN35 TaxID=3237286 RepID=UPI003526CC24
MEQVEKEHMYLHSQALRTFLAMDSPSSTLTENEAAVLLERMTRIEYQANETIFSEGEHGEYFYLIDQGCVDVIKESESNKVVNRLSEGDYFGELALFTNKPRAATVKARIPTVLFRMHKREFDELTQLFPEVFGALFKKLYDRLKLAYDDLDAKNEELRAAFQVRVELGFIFIITVVIVSLYAFVIRLAGSQAEIMTYIISRGVELLVLCAIIGIIYQSSQSLSSFGVTWKGGKRALGEGLWIAVLCMVVLLVGKWLLLQSGINMYGSELISFQLFDWTYLTYVVVAPLQEFIARGVMQSSIARLLVGRFRSFVAILVTSLIFGALHLHSSLDLGVAALVTSWLWGWMYTRHQNLIGVSVSHFFIGNWAGLLGFWANI